jgi:hypothetical protein
MKTLTTLMAMGSAALVAALAFVASRRRGRRHGDRSRAKRDVSAGLYAPPGGDCSSGGDAGGGS